MIIKTVQWNIGGGKVLADGADVSRLASYSQDGLGQIIAWLRDQNPDIIILQETHAANGLSQPEAIAKALGYEGWVNDDWADSHIEAGQRLGQGVVSRQPIASHDFEWFPNPNLEAVWEDGTIAKTHDKGRSRCYVQITPDQTLLVETLHTTPLHRFNVKLTDDTAKKIFAGISSKLVAAGTGTIQADFNVDAESLREFFPALFEAGFGEVAQTEVTTPKGERYDHVLYRGLKVLDSKVDSSGKTDHYPIVTRFNLAV